MGIRIHEAAIHNDDVSLLSEYQAREFGTVINSVARRHLPDEAVHAQSLSPAEDVYIPFQVRQALMTLTIRPPTEAELRDLHFYDLTAETPWKPYEFNDDESFTTCEAMADADVEDIPDVLPHPAMDLVEHHDEAVPHLVPFIDDNDDDDDLPDPPAQLPLPDVANPGEPNHPVVHEHEGFPSMEPNPAPVHSVSIPVDKTDIDPGGLNGTMTSFTTHKNHHNCTWTTSIWTLSLMNWILQMNMMKWIGY